MSMPARVEATLTEEQTRSVVESASGRDAISARSRSGHALLHQRRIAADVIDARLLRRRVHRARNNHGIAAGRRHKAGGRDGNALVDNRNAEFAFQRLARSDQIPRLRGDAVVDVPIEDFPIRMHAVRRAKCPS